MHTYGWELTLGRDPWGMVCSRSWGWLVIRWQYTSPFPHYTCTLILSISHRPSLPSLSVHSHTPSQFSSPSSPCSTLPCTTHRLIPPLFTPTPFPWSLLKMHQDGVSSRLSWMYCWRYYTFRWNWQREETPNGTGELWPYFVLDVLPDC